MRGVLTLLAKAKTCKELPEWKEVHAHIELPLVKAVREFDPTLKGGKTRWIETKKAIKDLTSDEVLKRGSAAVQVFQKWIEACRLVRSVCQQVCPPPTPPPTPPPIAAAVPARLPPRLPSPLPCSRATAAHRLTRTLPPPFAPLRARPQLRKDAAAAEGAVPAPEDAEEEEE